MAEALPQTQFSHYETYFSALRNLLAGPQTKHSTPHDHEHNKDNCTISCARHGIGELSELALPHTVLPIPFPFLHSYHCLYFIKLFFASTYAFYRSVFKRILLQHILILPHSSSMSSHDSHLLKIAPHRLLALSLLSFTRCSLAFPIRVVLSHSRPPTSVCTRPRHSVLTLRTTCQWVIHAAPASPPPHPTRPAIAFSLKLPTIPQRFFILIMSAHIILKVAPPPTHNTHTTLALPSLCALAFHTTLMHNQSTTIGLTTPHLRTTTPSRPFTAFTYKSLVPIAHDLLTCVPRPILTHVTTSSNSPHCGSTCLIFHCHPLADPLAPVPHRPRRLPTMPQHCSHLTITPHCSRLPHGRATYTDTLVFTSCASFSRCGLVPTLPDMCPTPFTPRTQHGCHQHDTPTFFKPSFTHTILIISAPTLLFSHSVLICLIPLMHSALEHGRVWWKCIIELMSH